uniref:Uncharacterized protein n=1 Tax=Octopus bimaculoides TaxID=37653 RepID=A0A0L8GHE1_OCTBM
MFKSPIDGKGKGSYPVNGTVLYPWSTHQLNCGWLLYQLIHLSFFIM